MECFAAGQGGNAVRIDRRKAVMVLFRRVGFSPPSYCLWFVSVVSSSFVTPRTKGSPSIPDAEDKKVARAFLLGPVPQKTRCFSMN
jgi:hypothetical protein